MVDDAVPDNADYNFAYLLPQLDPSELITIVIPSSLQMLKSLIKVISCPLPSTPSSTSGNTPSPTPSSNGVPNCSESAMTPSIYGVKFACCVIRYFPVNSKHVMEIA
jgi:hypothetical protein